MRINEEYKVHYNDTSLIISSGWKYIESLGEIKSPEEDIIIFIQILKLESNVEIQLKQLIEEKYNITNLILINEVVNLNLDLWQKEIQYFFTAKAINDENILATVKFYEDNIFVFLVKGPKLSFERRSSQINLSMSSWRPNSFNLESLIGRSVKKITTNELIEIEKFISDFMKEFSIPGISIGIIQDEVIILNKGYGVKNKDKSEPVTNETLFLIGSTTKPLTSLMMARLVENNILSWNSRVCDLLPEFKLRDEVLTNELLLKHTMSASTGMPRRDMEFAFGDLNSTIEQSLNQLSQMTPSTKFGETFQYSNLLVAAGGAAAAKKYFDGENLYNSFETALTHLVLKPLEMTNTRFKPDENDFVNLATPHNRDYSGEIKSFSQLTDEIGYSVAPSGVLWSNPTDILKYIALELKKGKVKNSTQIVSEQELLFRRQPGVRVNEFTHYGLGLFIEKIKDITVIHHGGNTHGFSSDMFFIPELNIGVSVLINVGGVNEFRIALRHKILELMLGAAKKSDLILSTAKSKNDSTNKNLKNRITLDYEKNKWLLNFVGIYHNDFLGDLKIEEINNVFYISNSRWKSKIGSIVDQSQNNYFALLDAPWGGQFVFMAKYETVLKLNFYDSQVNYVFNVK